MDLLVICQVLHTPVSWHKLLGDLALQWPRQKLLHLHLRGSGESLDQCLASLEEVAGQTTPFRILLHSGRSGLENVHAVVWLERTDE